MVVSSAEGVRPAERLTVSQAAEKIRYINQPGSYVGNWSNDTTPYLVEPMDLLSSLDYTGMIFVSAAQAGKTDMFVNWLASSVCYDPMDMMLIEKAKSTARDFSIRRIDKLHRDSIEVGKRLLTKRNYDNTFDKRYSNGMLVNLSWPSINELSGRPVPRLWLSDFDRMSQNIDGEGSPFWLAKKRATSFRRHGMCAAESSPGFIVDKTKWIPKTPHEAPPTEGILALYNSGDRRRWLWRCVMCGSAFEPDFSLLNWPNSEDLMESAEMATMRCPHCRFDYTHDEGDGSPGKQEMNVTRSKWIRDGQKWADDGQVVGTPFRSDIASFWLKGPAATFTTWRDLVYKFLQAEKEYQDTGSEEALKTTVNVDQGMPYTPKNRSENRGADTLQNRAVELGMHLVPHGVRFLVAAIDVQKNRFVVQVHGIGQGGDIWVVDRYNLIKSKRMDEDNERYLINAAAYLEDWKNIVEHVLLKSYELIDGSGRHMSIKMTVCDSGGKAGVTKNAYNFVRWLRRGDNEDYESEDGKSAKPEEGDYKWEPGLAARFLLVKGDSAPRAPRHRIGYPDAQNKDRHAGARGEIPILFLNTNLMKDSVDAMLDRTEPNGGKITFPSWLPLNFYTELVVEIRDAKRGWLNPKNYRNESWDLLVYCATALLTHHIGIEHIDWSQPPSYAAAWDKNSLVFEPAKETRPLAHQKKSAAIDWDSLGEDLA